jgi:NADH-quinone oxidoreductase subunit M
MIASFLNSHLPTLAILLPFLSAGVVLALPRNKQMLIRTLSSLMSLAVVVIASLLFTRAGGSGEFLLVYSYDWIPSLGISYHVGADSTSALLILISSLLTFVAFLSGKLTNSSGIKMMGAGIFVVLGGAIGVLSSLDAFLLCVFWQITLIPMCLIIGASGTGSRASVAMKFFIFAVASGLLMSVAVMYCGIKVGSFNLLDWYATGFGTAEQLWLFGSFALAFAVWVPILGLHTWMPSTVASAPIAAGVLLLGVMTNLGAYGFFRIALPLFPEAGSFFQLPLIIIAVACTVVGALLSLAQNNLRKIIAYATISQMGIVMLGLFVLSKGAAEGAIFFMAARALAVGVALMLVSSIEQRMGSCDIRESGGLARRAPMLSLFFTITILAMIGLPPLMNFAGIFTVLLGAFQVQTLITSIAIAGAAILSISLMWTVQRVLFGSGSLEDDGRTKDAMAHEYAVVIPMMALIIILGVVPHLLMNGLRNSSDIFVRFSKRAELPVIKSNELIDYEVEIEYDD